MVKLSDKKSNKVNQAIDDPRLLDVSSAFENS